MKRLFANKVKRVQLMKENKSIEKLLRLPFLQKFVRDNFIKRIVRNSGIIFSGNTMVTALNVASFTIMANKLGPEVLAVLVLSQTYALVINDIFNIQTWESMVKFGAEAKEKNDVASVIKTNLILDIISAVVAFVFAIVLIHPVVALLGWEEKHTFIISLYSISILFNITSFTIGIPRLFNKFYSVAKIQVAVSSLKLCCILFSMYYANYLLFYVCIYLFCDILLNISLISYSIVILRENITSVWWQTSLKIDKKQLTFIWWTNLRTIIRIPVRHLDMIMISSLLSIRTVGVYKVYKEIAGMLGRIAEPINQAIYPEFTKLLGNREIAITAGVIKKTIIMLSAVSLPITIILLLLSKIIVAQFFGNDYVVDIVALYLLLALYGAKLVTSPINALFIAAGFARYSFNVVLFTNLMYLLVVLLTSEKLGIYSLVAAFATQWALNKGLKIFLLQKYSAQWGQIHK